MLFNSFISPVNQWLDYLTTANSLTIVTAFFLLWFTLWLPLAIFLKWHLLEPLTVEKKLPLLGSLYLLAPLVIWLVANIRGVSFITYGLNCSPSFFISLILGFTLGVAGLALVFETEYLLGWLNWYPENKQRLLSIAFPIIALALWIGITEELVFRGFLINELTQQYNIWVGAIISSFIFALLHLVWERKETLPQLPGLWLMGIILVGARLVDHGNLGLASGLHVGWIWGLSCLDSAELIAYTGKGSEWITGLGKQPLAGVAGIICLLGTGAILMFGFARF